MRILILKSWLTNIGNGFIDRGAEAIVSKAFPDSTMVSVGGYTKLVEERRMRTLSSILTSYSGETSNPKNRYFHPAEHINPDVAILPGCMLYEAALKTYYPILKSLSNRNIPIILLGAGSGDYSPKARQYIKRAISELNIYSLISRNELAYDFYSDEVPHAHEGIDCAYFIDDWHNPANIDKKFSAATFDIIDEPKIEYQHEVVRPHHSAFDSPFIGLGKRALRRYTPVSIEGKSYGNKLNKPNTFLSDNLEDYLLIYKNSEEIHTDRIHASVPGLVFGGGVRFYYQTERSRLLNKVVDDDITKKVCRVNEEKLAREKEDQVNALKEAINSVSSI